jgi:hypothetical protein
MPIKPPNNMRYPLGPNPPTAETAHADSKADRMALETTANAQFIAQATEAIANATTNGLFSVTLTTFMNCNIVELQNYFISLGYQVAYPDRWNNYPSWWWGPAELFGFWWYDYWLRNGTPPFLYNPVRMKIIWVIVPPV